MEFDPITRANELIKKLQAEAVQKGLKATFEIHVENIGKNEGVVYVRKEKASGEVILYQVGGQGGED